MLGGGSAAESPSGRMKVEVKHRSTITVYKGDNKLLRTNLFTRAFIHPPHLARPVGLAW